MTIRLLPSILFLVMMTDALAGRVAAGPTQARNVLVVIADDLGVDKVGAYGFQTPSGSPTAFKTPTIDFLASNGILFRNAWSNPSCSPTRATSLTGQYSFRTGVGRWIRPHDLGLATRFDSIPDMLPFGYRTAAVGKWHLGGDFDCSSQNQCTGTYGHGHYSGFESHEGTFANFVQIGATGYSDWIEVLSNSSGVSLTHKSNYATTETVDDALATIAGFGNDPWFVWLGFNAPHKPWHEPPAHLYSGPSLGAHPSSQPVQAVQAMTEAMDLEFGRLLASLDPAVMANTTIIFFGDNGTVGAAQEAPFDTADGKGTLYNSGVNVPFIVYSPIVPIELRGNECQALVNTTDIFATVAELAAGDGSSGIDSVSFAPYLLDPSQPSIREFLFAEKFPENFMPPGTPADHAVTLRGERYKIIRRASGPDEFYDLLNDYHEEANMMPNGIMSDLLIYPDALNAFMLLSSELDRLCGC